MERAATRRHAREVGYAYVNTTMVYTYVLNLHGLPRRSCRATYWGTSPSRCSVYRTHSMVLEERLQNFVAASGVTMAR